MIRFCYNFVKVLTKPVNDLYLLSVKTRFRKRQVHKKRKVMKIYVLECRELEMNRLGDFIVFPVYFATSMDRIHAFIEKNKDFNPDRINYNWWWAAYAEELDGEIDDSGYRPYYNELEFYDWDGNNLNGWQPNRGYKEMYEYIKSEEENEN